MKGEASVASITFVISGLSGGGAERVCSNLANRFSADGHRCHVVTLAAAESHDYPLDGEVTRTALGLRAASSSIGQSLLALARRVNALRRALKDADSDTVVSFMDRTNVLVLLATAGLSCRVVVSERNYPPALPPGRFWGALRYVLYRFADTVVVQTRQGADWIKTHTLARKVASIPNWVDWPIANRQPVVPIPDALTAKTVLLAVGRDAPQKGFERLLRSFARIASSCPQSHLVIIGPAESSDLIPLCQQLGVEQRVLFPGTVGNMSDWYSRADIFVLSSRFEGFPNVLLEAMAAGCACISFDINTGPREIIADSVDGLLIPENDESLFERQLAALINDESLRLSLSSAAPTAALRYSSDDIYALWVTEILPA